LHSENVYFSENVCCFPQAGIRIFDTVMTSNKNPFRFFENNVNQWMLILGLKRRLIVKNFINRLFEQAYLWENLSKSLKNRQLAAFLPASTASRKLLLARGK